MALNWIACLAIVIGYLLVVFKRTEGFGVQIIGCLIYVCLYFNQDWSIVSTNTVFIITNILGIYRWVRKDDMGWNNKETKTVYQSTSP
jgi:hypothetical protein